MVIGQESGILKYMKKGAYLIDHTTSTPNIAVMIAEAAEKQGVHSVDAPVSGGDIGARNACLVVMCGGKESDVAESGKLMKYYS
jgi:3-hydroxyisobutyrate dehydrogenase